MTSKEIEAIEARLAELQEVQDEYDTLICIRDIEYLIAEGFITEEEGRLYPVDNACTISELLGNA